MAVKRKLFCLDAKQKQEICMYHANNASKMQQEIAGVLGLYST